MKNRYNEIEVHKINNSTTVFCHADSNHDNYNIVVKCFNREIYNRRFDRKNYNVYKNVIIERVKVITELNLFNKDYTMIEIGKRMYRTVDNGFHHFKELNRKLVPVDYDIDNEPIDFDLLIDCHMYDGIIYEANTLVCKFGNFYNDGKLLAPVDLVVKRVNLNSDVEMSKEDLEYGINSEVLNCLSWDYIHRDFTKYIYNDKESKIDRWY